MRIYLTHACVVLVGILLILCTSCTDVSAEKHVIASVQSQMMVNTKSIYRGHDHSFGKYINKIKFAGISQCSNRWAYQGVCLIKQVDGFDLEFIANRQLQWVELNPRGQVVGVAEVISKESRDCALILKERNQFPDSDWWLTVKQGTCLLTCKLSAEARGTNVRIYSECIDTEAASLAQGWPPPNESSDEPSDAPVPK